MGIIAVDNPSMLRDFFNIFFPALCATCENPLVKNEKLICTTCRIELPRIKMDPLMLKRLSERMHGEVPFKHVLAFYKFYKTGITQRLLHQLKYGGQPEIGLLVGNWFGHEIVEEGIHTEFDAIIPVPLHKKKIRSRGYNQSAFIAEGISNCTGIPVMHALIRTVLNETQTNKNRIQRWNNVHGIFKVTDKKKIGAKRILVVDDVLTTGATLQSCALELIENKASSVSAAALALAM
jgi:ComF family protein